jgi:glycosyltransferase involved in cell wall biosynthesis
MPSAHGAADVAGSLRAVRVTYLHQYFATPEGSTGTRSYELARRLVARGHQVTVVTSNAQLPEFGDATTTVRTTVEGIRLVVIPVAYANEMGYRARIGAFLRFALRASVESARVPADVVLASSTPLTIALPGLVARVARRAPMVFEVRDLWPEMPIAVGALRNPVLRAVARGVEWVAYHGAAHVFALSPGMADGVARRGIPRSRITMIPNGCDTGTFDVPAAAGDAVRAEANLAPGAPLVVYAGALGAVNGVEWLADVAAEVRPLAPEVRFLVVGRGAGREALLQRARKRGVLDTTLTVRDPVRKRDMPALLAAATVATSLFRPIPEMEANSANKFFDALAAGRPVAINYGGWHRDLLTETGAGVALPPDPVTAARELATFLADPMRVRAAGAAARELARTRFDRDALAAQFASVLEAVGQ